jgi:hypothetical protein
MAVLFLRHYSGTTHKLGDRKAAKLKRELAAGRGGAEVTALTLNGYNEFLGPEGEDVPLTELRAEHIK